MEGAGNDSKSSAGDKHETARAMMQLEQEKLGGQLTDALKQKATLEQIDIEHKSDAIHAGSVVKTNRGYLFISVPLGKINVNGTDVILLSIHSPLGQKLSGLQRGDTAEINGIQYIVEQVL